MVIFKSWDSLWPHGLQHARLFCPPLSPRVCWNSCQLSRWCYLSISSSAATFSFWVQSFLASGSFPICQLFVSCGQSTGASTSASVLLMNIQVWFPSGLTDLISSLSKGHSRVPHHNLKKINSSVLILLYSTTLTSVRDYRENHSFDCIDLCWQCDVSAF